MRSSISFGFQDSDDLNKFVDLCVVGQVVIQYFEKFTGEDLSICLNEIESIGLRKS